MEKISYKLNDFEGPLDLLLHLIKKNKLNIYDIQISELLAQYLAHLEKMKELSIEISSEFLEMAARLVYIKTAFLLPKHEEAEELKQELTGQLLEYKQCQEVARLMAQEMNFDFFARDAEKIIFDMTYTKKHNIFELFKSYMDSVGRKNQKLPPSRESFSVIVSRKIVSVFSKVVFILRKLKKLNKENYDNLFSESKSKSELVATFLAVLELVKGKRIALDDENNEIKLLDARIKF